MGMAGDDRFLDGLVALDQRMVTLVSLDGLFAGHGAPSAANDVADTRTAA
jgi:hypothetical protein